MAVWGLPQRAAGVCPFVGFGLKTVTAPGLSALREDYSPGEKKTVLEGGAGFPKDFPSHSPDPGVMPHPKSLFFNKFVGKHCVFETLKFLLQHPSTKHKQGTELQDCAIQEYSREDLESGDGVGHGGAT